MEITGVRKYYEESPPRHRRRRHSSPPWVVRGVAHHAKGRPAGRTDGVDGNPMHACSSLHPAPGIIVHHCALPRVILLRHQVILPVLDDTPHYSTDCD